MLYTKGEETEPVIIVLILYRVGLTYISINKHLISFSKEIQTKTKYYNTLPMYYTKLISIYITSSSQTKLYKLKG